MKRLLLILFYCLPFIAQAIDTHTFTNPQQQASYESLISELRCLVCQNQTIGDSNADLAKDLREQIFEMLNQGKSKQDIIDYMTARYGDFVLYKPPFNLTTSLLWLAPALFLIIGIISILIFIRAKKTNNTIIDAEKLAQARALLAKGHDR
jgi:cytochrome c-type biogenesis protein CcmH